MRVPVVFIIFNRPDLASQVFERIRTAQPSKLFVISDGPRADVIGEKALCDESRAIIETVDWKCDVRINHSENNLGCGKRISSGLDWVFETEEKAIVLEDDCLPEPSFFRFCEEMLNRYQDSEIGAVSGNNFVGKQLSGAHSYYFSRYPHVWGWATWREKWKAFDFGIPDWPHLRETHLLEIILDDKKAVLNWTYPLNLVHEGKLNTWDFQWTFTCWKNNWLSILPSHNLITNLGFRQDGTHAQQNSPLGNIPTFPMSFPLNHPSSIERNIDADRFTQFHRYENRQSLPSRLVNFAIRHLRLNAK